MIFPSCRTERDGLTAPPKKERFLQSTNVRPFLAQNSFSFRPKHDPSPPKLTWQMMLTMVGIHCSSWYLLGPNSGNHWNRFAHFRDVSFRGKTINHSENTRLSSKQTLHLSCSKLPEPFLEMDQSQWVYPNGNIKNWFHLPPWPSSTHPHCAKDTNTT